MQTLNLVKVLVAEGYHVTLCCYYEFDERMVRLMESAGAEVVLLNLDRSGGRSKITVFMELIRHIVKVICALQPDVVHVQYVAPGLIPIIAARIARTPVIFATVHQPGRLYSWKARFLLRIAARLCTAFFCVSKAAEESWFGNSNDVKRFTLNVEREMLNVKRHFTIYNAVDVAHINRVVGETDINEIKRSLGIGDKKVIGVVGRLRWEKGQGFLLDAMVEVLKNYPEVMLLVIGDGPDREDLMKKAVDLGIGENVVWLGQKEHEETIRLYSVMDFLVVPSIFEGFGLTAAEGMAAGLPVVGTKVDGLKEVINDEVTGYLVPFGDTNTLAQSIAKLLLEPEVAKAMGAKGYERAKKTFSIERFAESIIAAYVHFVK